MTLVQPSEYDKRLATQVDATMREIVVHLLMQGFRLTPQSIDRVRAYVVAGMLESGRLALAQDASRRRAQVMPGPWDDEPTNPGRPSNRPRKP
jgi:hypothetical protein